MNAKDFILANTSPMCCQNVESIALYQAREIHDLWHKTQNELDRLELPPPFWAFAWAGGEALARYILENPELVHDKKVLDFAAGSGLVAIAACKAGAKHVTANDIDPFACKAMALNAALNHVRFDIDPANLLEQNVHYDVILAGDIFYDCAMAKAASDWLQKMNHQGTLVLAGDPGRAYVPYDRLKKIREYSLTTSKAIEDAAQKSVRIWQFSAQP